MAIIQNTAEHPDSFKISLAASILKKKYLLASARKLVHFLANYEDSVLVDKICSEVLLL